MVEEQIYFIMINKTFVDFLKDFFTSITAVSLLRILIGKYKNISYLAVWLIEANR